MGKEEKGRTNKVTKRKRNKKRERKKMETGNGRVWRINGGRGKGDKTMLKTEEKMNTRRKIKKKGKVRGMNE